MLADPLIRSYMRTKKRGASPEKEIDLQIEVKIFTRPFKMRSLIVALVSALAVFFATAMGKPSARVEELLLKMHLSEKISLM